MDSYEWLSQLITFDTTSRNSNLKLITMIENWLKNHNIVSQLTYDLSGKKANLFATLPGRNGNKNGGLLLSGHTDVVPVEGQRWDTDPFLATTVNNRIYGRGSCDMKGFIAVVLAMVPEFQRLQLSYPIHLAFSYDEEIGCLGAPLLIADFQKHGIQPKACIVGEPTNVCPVVAHKGIQGYRCRVHGRAAHSSLTPSGCNAIEYAAELICWIHNFASRLKQYGPVDENFDVSFTSMTTNMIQGGNALNIIPAMSEFLFEFRNLPEVNPQTIITQIKTHISEILLPKMRSEYSDALIEIESLGDVPAFEADENAAITQLAYAINNESEIRKVSYATEAGLFQQAGISTIVCGPGSIEQAHRANEFVTVEQINKCEEFLRRLVRMFH